MLLSAAGLAGWCGYLWSQFGNPLAFVAVQAAPGWDQGSGPATWLKFTFIETIGRRLANPTMLLTAQALAGLAAVLLLGHVRRRLGWGYTVYSLLVLVIPLLGTKDFMGWAGTCWPRSRCSPSPARHWRRPVPAGCASCCSVCPAPG